MHDGSHPVVVRPILAQDLSPLLASVGPLVDDLYPRGAEKLLQRLESALNGYANATVAASLLTGRPLGLASEASKGRAAAKLSTFWVHPVMRRRGIGHRLLDARICNWQRNELERVVVTVRAERAGELEALFLPRGFVRIANDRARYGVGRDEVVLEWKPTNASSQVA